MTDPELRFLNHACIRVEHGSEALLCDPWFSGRVFNQSWGLLEETEVDALDLRDVRHIWISHEHPDHLHFPTLRAIRERISGEVTVYYRRQKAQHVREALEGLGFSFVALAAGESYRLGAGFSITPFESEDDCALLIEAGDRVILNQNDCRLSDSNCRKIKQRFPRIDAWLFQFSLAGYCGNRDDPEALRGAHRAQLESIRHYHAHFSPEVYIPFASFIYFCKVRNAYLNDFVVDIEDVWDMLRGRRVQILCPDEALDWEAQGSSSQASRAFWGDSFKRERSVYPSEATSEARLCEAGQNLVEEAARRIPRFFRIPEVQLETEDTGQVFSLDFRRVSFGVVAQADPEKCAGSLPSEDLLSFIENPTGGDTLNISACFDVRDQWLWLRMIHFRHALYTTSTSRFGWAHLVIKGGAKAAGFLARRLRQSRPSVL